jgi:signal transduction histidine kinase
VAQATSSQTNSKRRYIKSSSFVMALLFTVLCGAAATALGFFINYFTKGHFVHSTEAVLDAQIALVETSGLATARAFTSGLYIPLDNNELPDTIPQDLQVLSEGILVFTDTSNEQRYAAKVHTYPNGQKLLVGTNISVISQDFEFMQWLGITSIIFVMLVVFVSYLISIFVVSGTNQIAATAQDIIKTGDLSQRIDVRSGWDDLSSMATVLNLLLDRIEVLMQGVKQVTDNIAHDLRRPLTRLRNQIEAMPSDDIREELLEETDHLLDTFNALLRISKIEHEQQRSQFTSVQINEVLADVIDFYEPLAETKHIDLHYQGTGFTLSGDRDLLFQAFANLLDNAIKYTPEHGQVDIVLQVREHTCSVSFFNTCDPVSEAVITRMFDRFFRAADDRHASGNGLGLALVKAVIELHNGTIEAHNTDQGFSIITNL